MPVLDRSRAFRILGLSEGVDDGEIRSAYHALRAHVEARAAAAPDERFRQARRDELLDLERALRALGSLPARKLVPRWVLGWAIVATILTLALTAAYLARLEGVLGPPVIVAGSGEGGGGPSGFAIEGASEEGDGDGGSGDVASAGPRAKLVAKSRAPGATLEVRTRGEAPEVVAEGAADETEYWLAPGAYALRVSHEDCKGAWERDVDASGGDELVFEPEPCKDTGWVVVQSNVAEDELTIDGERLGATGEERRPLSAGEHEVRVAKSGYQAWEGIVDVQPGRVLGIRPRLERAAKVAREPKPRRPPATAQREPQRERDATLDESWHEQARQWLLSRYDLDRSGALDSQEEIDAVPCERWLGLEASHSQSRLGLTLTRFYGFDGNGWRSGALGVADEIRDLAYERMKHCGLR